MPDARHSYGLLKEAGGPLYGSNGREIDEEERYGGYGWKITLLNYWEGV